MLKPTLTLLSLFLLFTAVSQTFRFNRFTMEEGLPQDFIYSINQDEKGYLWIGTGEGLAKFDGHTFQTYSTNDSLAENVITCSHVDEDGTIWFGHNNGQITRFQNGKFIPFEHKKSTSTVTDLTSIGTKIYYTTQNNGVFSFSDDKISPVGKFGKDNFFAINNLKKDLLIGTASGLIHLSKVDGKWTKKAVHMEDSWITDLSASIEEDVRMIGTNSGELIRTKMGKKRLLFSAWNGSLDLTGYQIKSVLQDEQGAVWLGTNGQGLVKLHVDSTGEFTNEKTVYAAGSGMNASYIQSLFQDREGNIWIGSFGKGLYNLIDDFFTFYEHDPEKFGNSVSAILMDGNSKWYGVENGLIHISPDLPAGFEFFNQENGLCSDKITSLYKHESQLYIGTYSNGAYVRDLETGSIKRINWEYGLLQSRINDIDALLGKIWFATNGGLIIYDPESKETTIYDTESGMPHNAIKAITNGGTRMWMGTHSRYLYSMTETEMQQYEMAEVGELEILDITVLNSNSVWVATKENGVYEWTSDGFNIYSKSDGLASSYCYSIAVDVNKKVWVGHNEALSKISPKSGDITVYDYREGVDDLSNQRAMFLDELNYLWIGTEGGAIKYDARKEVPKDIPPMIDLLRVVINDSVYDISEEIKLDYGNYRIHFDFIGISFVNPEKITYRYQLEGYDGILSDPSSEPVMTYGRISDGEYRFTVSACNEYGICSEYPATINISIAKPFWKKWWFFSLIIVTVATGFVLFVRIRTRRLIAQQEYLEEQLEIKTREVVQKADEIAEINKDLTSSINYAERIQKAILPPHEVLSDALPHSFIFFRPRDIVSGDFYYIERIEEKLIVVCADCTGHGVPGAFMSMIGSVALRNIYEKMELTGEWKSPEQVLEELDREVEIVLQQKAIDEMEPEEAFFHSRDGMDLTVCHIDLNTKEVSLSAAMRTSLIFQGEKVEIISGDKRPIGGGERRGIEFTKQQFKMNDGDLLLLFSDGYTDQFGGDKGRKLKLSGTMKIVDSMVHLNPEEHAKFIETHFDNWQGDWDQIDDVLFMGLRF